MKSTKYTPNAITAIRVKKGYTIDAIATLLSVSSAQVENWEYGSVVPSSVHLLQLCAMLETSVELLYPEEYKKLMSRE